MADSNEIRAMLRDSAISFLADCALSPSSAESVRTSAAIDVPQPVDRARWQQIAELGWLGLGIPESHGGSALDVAAACTLAEQLGVHGSALPYVACAVMPAKILEQCADHPEAAALIDGLVTGKHSLTVAWQENLNTLDAGLTQTRLENRTVIGKKLFVPAVDADSLLLVSVTTPDGPAIAVVEASACGVHIETFATSGSNVAHIRFDAAPLYRDTLLLTGQQAVNGLRQAIDVGRIAIAAQLAGHADGCLDKTLQHLRARQQFGKPLASFQVLRHRAVDLSIATQLAGASWRNAAKSFDEKRASRAAISAAKARCGDTALKVAKESVQMHGAMGFTEETGVGRYYRAALFANGWLGNATQHRRVLMQARHEGSTIYA